MNCGRGERLGEAGAGSFQDCSRGGSDGSRGGSGGSRGGSDGSRGGSAAVGEGVTAVGEGVKAWQICIWLVKQRMIIYNLNKI